jgi:hypothetical protein
MEPSSPLLKSRKLLYCRNEYYMKKVAKSSPSYQESTAREHCDKGIEAASCGPI